MIDHDRHNEEFSTAWDEIRELRENPDFDLQIHLDEKGSALSSETIYELRIACELEGLLELNAEHEMGILGKTGGKRKPLRLTVLVKRTMYIAACLAISLTVYLCVMYLRPAQFRMNFNEIADPEFLLQTACAANEEFGISDECWEMKKNLSPIADRWRAQFEIGGFKYDDIDNDGVIDFIFAKNGNIVCFDLHGKSKWHLEITLDDFDIDYKTKLLDSLRDRIADTLNFKDIPPVCRDLFRKLIFDNFAPDEAREIFSRDIMLETGETSRERRKIIRGLVFEKMPLEEAWQIGSIYVKINRIYDYDNDGFKEIFVTAEGAMFVISHDGKWHEIIVDGSKQKHITILEGTHLDSPTAIGDINNDGEPEIIVYRNTGYPVNQRTGDNLSVDKNQKDESVYIYKGNDIFNARGIYVADSTGREIWHLNLPWHNLHTGICDWDNDGKKEIIIDAHTPNNGYVVRYNNEYREYVGSNFDWDSLPNGFQDNRLNFPSELQDDSVAFLILGMENNTGRIEYYLSYPKTFSYQFICSRCIQSGSSERINLIQYHMKYEDETEVTSEWKHEPWIQSGNNFIKAKGKMDGYPDLYHFPDAGLFSLKIGDETRLIYGICPFNKVVMTDNNYRILKSFNWDPEEIPPEYNWNFRADIQDAVVMDVGDLDGNGTPEILVAFGDLKPPWNRQKYSVIKILTRDLQEYHPEKGWSTYIVEGAVKEARFDDVDDDGQKDIIILSDFAYFITPRK